MKAAGQRSDLHSDCSVAVQTADGEFLAHYSDKGLCGLDFPSRVGQDQLRSAGRAFSAEVSAWHRLTTEALICALAGRKPERLPPLDLSAGTEFQRCVWAALRSIEAGTTLTYGEVARAIGRPRAVRAVGGACGANPVPVLVPCHRVLAAGSRLGGFGGGLQWKRLLLGREGVRQNTEPQSPNNRKASSSELQALPTS
jgi:O-6-methylguanine DNA methyltransferase